MNKQQGGFTLIELVVVIVILGILAATALPKFVDLRSDASLAATQGVAGAINSAMAVNYGAYIANSTKGVAINGNVTTSAVVNSVLQGGLPAGYSVSPTGATCGASAGVTAALTVTGTNSQTAAATLICTG